MHTNGLNHHACQQICMTCSASQRVFMSESVVKRMLSLSELGVPQQLFPPSFSGHVLSVLCVRQLAYNPRADKAHARSFHDN